MRTKFSRAALLLLFASTACGQGASSLPKAESPFAPSSDLTAQNACRTIVDASGPMVLKGDLAGPDASCLRVVGGSGDLDCQGHDVQSIDLTEVNGLTVRNCRMRGLIATRSTNVTITNNTFTADPRKTVGTVIKMSAGSNNRVAQNTIDGSWRGQAPPIGGYPPGADDGILIENDANLLIEGNTIRNIWDCGIERVGNATDPITIRGNEIDNAGECGIGSWFAAGWRDSLILDNSVSNSPVFIEFYYSATQNRGVDHIALRNNVFERNRFSPSVRSTTSVSIDFVNGVSRMPLDIGNNIFRSNDFASYVPAPRLAPASGFVDGGENICRQDSKSTLSCVR